MRNLDFTFEELPLLIDFGFEAGLVNGSAAINYHRDGEWSIDAIYLDGHKPKSSDEIEAAKVAGKRFDLFHRKPVSLERGSTLYAMIYGRLDGEWKPRIQDKVDEANDEAYASRFDNRADARRDFLRAM